MLRNLLLIPILLASTLSLPSCYRIPVPQGNYLTPADANKVKTGMSSDQVISTLGNPVLNNTYANGQLAYVYSYKKGLSKIKMTRMIIYFTNNRVTDVMFDDNAVNGKLPRP